MARERILLVDDEPNVLAGYERRLRREFSAVTAVGGAAGLSALAQQGPFAVVVADMRMPGLDGVQFLIRVREMAPDSVRVMLTGHADAETVINAINEGSVFRFLTKPCPAETLSKTLWDAIGQYRLVRAERELLDSTLNGVVEVLTDVMRVADPEARGRFPLRRDIEVVCRALGLTRDWDIKLASLLMDIGMATIPASTRAKVDSGRAAYGRGEKSCSWTCMRRAPGLFRMCRASNPWPKFWKSSAARPTRCRRRISLTDPFPSARPF
ncbi:MAG: response regulator [Deltaproteobacteria bacterium]|nr:response regulator [Deltaproteobacteria bacterium]